MISMVQSISIGQLELAAWPCSLLAPAHLLISQTWKTKKSTCFLIKNCKYQCIINIILILNPKHISYQEENELCPSQNQDNI